jgi:hypothetical protein
LIPDNCRKNAGFISLPEHGGGFPFEKAATAFRPMLVSRKITGLKKTELLKKRV